MKPAFFLPLLLVTFLVTPLLTQDSGAKKKKGRSGSASKANELFQTVNEVSTITRQTLHVHQSITFDSKQNSLKDALEDNDQVLLLFYDNDAPKIKTLLGQMEKLDVTAYPDLATIKCSDEAEAAEFGVQLEELPKLLLFDNGIPEEYAGDLADAASVAKWLKNEMESTEVQVLDLPTMEKVVQSGSPFVIMFVLDHTKALDSEGPILKLADKYDIGVAKVV